MTQLELFPVNPVTVVGAPDLVPVLREVIRAGFGDRARDGCPASEVRWNPRLRTTVARVRFGAHPTIEVATVYHEAHPQELVETLAHEYAHVLVPDGGHGRTWRAEFLTALDRLGLDAPPDLLRARHLAPGSGRYLWLCSDCEAAVGAYASRRRDEVATRSLCCHAPVRVLDRRSGSVAPPRPFRVHCRRCGVDYAAYDESRIASTFARRHRCRCGARLRVAGSPRVESHA